MLIATHLFVALLVLTISIYFLNGKRVLSVSFLVSSMFLVSSFFYLVDYNWFRHELSFETIWLIIRILIFIFIADFLVHFSNLFVKNSTQRNYKSEPICFSSFVLLFFVFIITVSGFLYFNEVYHYSLQCGNSPGNYFSMAEFVRQDKGYSKSFFVSQTTIISDCILYVLIYAFISNAIIHKRKNYQYLLACLPYILHIFANDSRTNVLRIICVVCIITFVCIKRKTAWTSKGNIKIIIFGLLGITSFIVLFRLLGNRTGVTAKYDLIHNISKYVSSSLIGLDFFVKDGLESGATASNLFAPHMFNRLYEFLNNLGFDFNTLPHHDEFYSFYGSTSNIYTGIKQLVLDFGTTGSYIVVFLISAIASFFIEGLKNNKRGFVYIIFVAYILYPMIMLSISNVFTELINVGTIYTFFYLFLIDYFCVKKRVYYVQRRVKI